MYLNFAWKVLIWRMSFLLQKSATFYCKLIRAQIPVVCTEATNNKSKWKIRDHWDSTDKLSDENREYHEFTWFGANPTSTCQIQSTTDNICKLQILEFLLNLSQRTNWEDKHKFFFKRMQKNSSPHKHLFQFERYPQKPYPNPLYSLRMFGTNPKLNRVGFDQFRIQNMLKISML